MNRAKPIHDPLISFPEHTGTIPCAAGCGLEVFVDMRTYDGTPVTCLSCEQASGKAVVMDGDSIRVLEH